MDQENVKKRPRKTSLPAKKNKKQRRSAPSGNHRSIVTSNNRADPPEKAEKTTFDLLLQSFTQVHIGEDSTKLSFAVEDYGESPSTSRDSFSPLATVTRAPTLPMDICSKDGFIIDEGSSDGDSDFCPDWSSDSSRASSDLALENEDSRNYVIGQTSPEDTELEFVYKKSPKFIVFSTLPVPAAGNEDEGATTSSADDEGRESPSKLKPQAIRRVKSMTFEGKRDSEIDASTRSKVLMRKHARDVTPSQLALSPSPLLSPEDAGSLKRSPSQLSAKYSLKRSRSNLAVTENYAKRHPNIFDSDIIHEESDEDSVSDIAVDTENGSDAGARKAPSRGMVTDI